jgi:hypothetical protein
MAQWAPTRVSFSHFWGLIGPLKGLTQEGEGANFVGAGSPWPLKCPMKFPIVWHDAPTVLPMFPGVPQADPKAPRIIPYPLPTFQPFKPRPNNKVI